MIRVVARTNPFNAEPLVCEEFSEGQSVADIIGGMYQNVHVAVDGETIPHARWAETYPKDGAIVTAVIVPEGPVKVIALAVAAAIAQAAAAAAAAIGSALGAIAGAMGTVVGTIGGVSVTVGGIVKAGLAIGMTVMSALIRPQAPSIKGGIGQGSRYTALTGGSNQIARFEVFPKLYGTFRIVPPLGATIYTESVGNDQYMRMLLCLGYGPMSIGGRTVGPGYGAINHTVPIPVDTIRIGETPISSFQGVEWEIGTINQLTLYTNDVAEQVLSVDFKHNQPNAEGGWFADNITAIRTTDDGATYVSLDIAYPSLIGGNKKGQKRTVHVEWRVEYAPAGSGAWTTAIETWTHTGQTQDPLRFAYGFGLPYAGRWDIRLTRKRTYVQDQEVLLSDAIWTALRSVRPVTVWIPTNTVMMTLRIKSSGQLNGNIDPVSILATSVLPVWNGAAWVYQATANPAWAYADALRGPQLKHPVSDSRIDTAALLSWAQWCDANGITYNWYHTDQETLLDRIRAIATAGRASWALPEGKFSVVRDNQTTPIQLISPRNSRNFKYEKRYQLVPHALRVRYIDPVSWQPAERVVYDDGYSEANATRYEILETQGVTNATQAFKEGRYFMAAMRLRPETYTVEMDIENIVVTRGDVARLAHDVLAIGVAWGRIKTVVGGGTGVIVDEELTMEAGKNYGLRIRKQDSSHALQQITTVAGTHTEVTFTAPVSGLNEGDLFAFGELNTETIPVKVTDIEYHEDFTATLTMVPAAFGIQDLDFEPIPDFNPVITLPPSQRIPPAPTIDLLYSNSATLLKQADGSFTPGVRITWSTKSFVAPYERVEVVYWTNVNAQKRLLFPADAAFGILDGITAQSTLYAQIRVRSVYGKWSPLSAQKSAYVVGPEASPSNVSNFAINVIGATAHLTWDPLPDADISHYRIKFAPQTSGVTWGSSVDLVPNVAAPATSVVVPAMVGTYLIKAVDFLGFESTDTVSIVSNIAAIEGLNAVDTVTEHTAFSGSKSGVRVVSNGLELDDASTMNTWATLAEVERLAAGIVETGTYTFAGSTDLTEVYTSRLTANFAAEGKDTNNVISAWTALSSVEVLDRSDPSQWAAELQVRTTNDDPAGTPTWSEWKPFVIGDYTARAFEWRVVLTSVETGITPRITELEVSVDMPDRVAEGHDIASNAAGDAITFSPAFKETPAIGISAQNLATGDYYTITSKSRTGFTIRFFNASGTGISRTYDWTAKGYGYVH
jgi:hypothetical protein